MASPGPDAAGVPLQDLTGIPPTGITRRSFLAAANALALIAVLEACTGKHHPAAASTSATGAAGTSPTAGATSAATVDARGDLLSLLRQAVQASPDFLQQAAAKAVASKNITTITAFVRDQISVIPSWGQGDDPVSATRWGSHATLRAGAGTLRDRADLLVELLTAAGFTATVLSADLPSAINLPTLYQVRAAEFEPDETLYAKAVALLPAGTVLPTPAAASTSGPAESPAEAAAKAIAAVIPADLQSATIRKDLLPTSVPVVAVATTSGGPTPSAAAASGTQQYLFALGDLAPTATPPAGLTSANQVVPTPQVSVTVTAMTNPAPGSMTPSGQVVQLVSGSWPAEQVFGRQVLLSFVPPSGATGFLTGSPSDQAVRVPLLRVQGELPAFAAPPIAASSPAASTVSLPSTSPGTSSDAVGVFTGAPITLQGDVLAPPQGSSDDTASLQGAYGAMTTLSDSQRKTAISRATTLQAVAKASTFPEVELDVAVLDSSGNSIDGLDASAFTIKDNGTTASSIALMSNAVASNKPRVLVIYDTTGSVEETWPSAAAKATFEQSLTTTLIAAAQQTPFDVQVLGLDDAYSPDATKWTAPDQAGLIAAFANARGSNSIVWSAAGGGAISQGVVAMIMVSDFVSGSESPTDIATAQRRIAAAHIPVICLTVAKPDATAVATMVKLSGGTQLDPLAPTTSSAIAALIKPLVAVRTMNTYRMRYAAPTGGSTTHMVTITLAGRSTPAATTMYTAPATPATPWSFAGLYVRISVGSYDSGVRHLAGVNLAGSNPIQALDDAAAAAETRAALCGLTTIAIEPGTVTTAAIVDDLISSVQSIQPVLALTKSATPQDVVAAAAKSGVRRVPPVLLSLLRAPVADSNPTAVPTMQVAILQERSGPLGGVETRMDMPPTLNTIEPLGTDPVAAFAKGLAISSKTAAAEAANFDSSAFASLAGRSLTVIGADDDGGLRTFVNGLPAAQQDSWEAVLILAYETQTQIALVPTGGATAAFWVVDSKTGAVTAVLLDGSGGAMSMSAGSDCASTDVDTLTAIIDGLNLLLAVLQSVCIATASEFCIGVAANAVFTAVALILAVIGAAHSGASFTGIGSLGSLFISIAPKGIPAPAPLKIIGLLAFAAAGALPDPCGPAQAAPAGQGDNGGADNGGGGGDQAGQPVPACGVDGSDDGSC
jgi:hypothetical protein